MSKKLLGALVALGLLGSAGAASGNLYVPLTANVANVCSVWDYYGDVDGIEYTQTRENLGTYKATQTLTGRFGTSVRCTKGTQVTAVAPDSVRLSGPNGDYLDVSLRNVANGDKSTGHLIPDSHGLDNFYTIAAGQWGAAKGVYSGTLKVTYTYF